MYLGCDNGSVEGFDFDEYFQFVIRQFSDHTHLSAKVAVDDGNAVVGVKFRCVYVGEEVFYCIACDISMIR